VDDDQGWGVLDSAVTLGGCWVHYSALEMPGYRTLTPGQDVSFEFEAADQDGFRFRATRVQPS
jgi:cold shock protein